MLKKSEPVFLKIATIIKPHGLYGEVVVELSIDIFADVLSDAKLYLGDPREEISVQTIRKLNQRFILAVEGWRDRSVAEKYRNADIFVRKDDVPALPEGEYYFHELIGSKVIGENGTKIGTLVDIIKTGANDVYIISPSDNNQDDILIPAIQSVVKKIDVKNKMIQVNLPEWR